MGSTNETSKFNPFPGLRPFAPEESDLFFGREKESREVLEKLLRNRFITVIGASGTGKSSLIYCGVLPRVRDKGLKESSIWRIITFRPGNDPFGNLGEAISINITESGMGKVSNDAILLDMHLNADGLAMALNKYLMKGNEKVLLVIDQFEELFRYSTLSAGGQKGGHAVEFVEKMVNAVNQVDSRIFTIITMRSDFIGECAHYQGLTQLINNSNYLVPHMDRENYRQAIEGPVKYAGAEIDQKLVETILDDIGDRTDQLPVLQHALMRTWTYWQELDEPGRPITYTDYDAVGTMSDAMSRHANEAFEELTPRGKEICEKMFKTITEKGTDNKGIRHPSSITTLMSVIQCTNEELYEVVEKFRIPSRSFITPRQDFPLNNDSIIDLSHESLMRLWDRLKEWVDDEAASVQMYLRLSDASAMYQLGKTSLWRPPDLQLAINWRDQHKPTITWAQRYDPAFERAMVYLRTSEQAWLDEEESKIRLQKKQIRRTRIVAIILGTAAMISLGFMLFAFVQRIAAENQRKLAVAEKLRADLQAHKADSNRVVADTARALAVKNEHSARQNAEEARKQQGIAEFQRGQATKNAEIARQQADIARAQSDSAKAARIVADTNANRAVRQRTRADNLRRLTIGKSMSIKSLQVQDTTLKTLLAYQAYIFNKKYGGLANDADIYNGLYDVAKRYGNMNYKTFKGQPGWIKSIAFVPGRKEFFTCGDDGRVLKWDLDGKATSYQMIYTQEKTGDIIEVVAVSPDASWLACGSANSQIHMIPLKGNNMKYDLTGHKGSIRSLVFSFDGKYLYSASLDGKVLKWDMAARTSSDITTGNMKITSIDISSNGNYIAGINSEENVIVWNPENKNDNFSLKTERKNVRAIRFKPDENTLAIGDKNGNIEIWDIATNKIISQVKAHSAEITDIKFNTLLKQMATSSSDKTTKIFNISTITDLTEPPVTLTDDDFVWIMEFSPDGQLIVTGAYQGAVNLLSRPTHADNMVTGICNLVRRNMTQEEWNTYVAKDIPVEKTCTDKDYSIKVNVVR